MLNKSNITERLGSKMQENKLPLTSSHSSDRILHSRVCVLSLVSGDVMLHRALLRCPLGLCSLRDHGDVSAGCSHRTGDDSAQNKGPFESAPRPESLSQLIYRSNTKSILQNHCCNCKDHRHPLMVTLSNLKNCFLPNRINIFNLRPL